MKYYVDTETKTCYFGYAGVGVSESIHSIIFREINKLEKPGTVLISSDGTKNGDWEYTENVLQVSFDTINELKTFSSQIEKIEENQGGIFTFKDITFDFTLYSPDSIEVIKHHIKGLLTFMIRPLAC